MNKRHAWLEERAMLRLSSIVVQTYLFPWSRQWPFCCPCLEGCASHRVRLVTSCPRRTLSRRQRFSTEVPSLL